MCVPLYGHRNEHLSLCGWTGHRHREDASRRVDLLTGRGCRHYGYSCSQGGVKREGGREGGSDGGRERGSDGVREGGREGVME